jgi:hypothetical protein
MLLNKDISLYKSISRPSHQQLVSQQKSSLKTFPKPKFSYMDSNHDLLNQNQACYRCTIGKYIRGNKRT